MIPNGEVLFRYALPAAFPDGQIEIPSAVFIDINLSCDWERYRNDPTTSFHVAQGKRIVISINTCDEIRRPRNPRSIEVPSAFQEIVHDPVTDPGALGGINDAHSLVRGNKKALAVAALQKHSTWQRV